MGQLALCGAVVSSDALAVTSQNFVPSKAREKKQSLIREDLEMLAICVSFCSRLWLKEWAAMLTRCSAVAYSFQLVF